MSMSLQRYAHECMRAKTPWAKLSLWVRSRPLAYKIWRTEREMKRRAPARR